jgi:hypothetical protein
MKQSHSPKANAEVMPRNRPFVSEIPKLRKMAASLSLVSLANDTKWNELITLMRDMQDTGWSPDFRVQCIDSDYISGWDGEWWHHLPFPMISTLWMDLRCIEVISKARLLSDEVIDHTSRISKLLTKIGLDYEIGSEAIRIYGYGPRCHTDFTK